MGGGRILFLYENDATFVRDDLATLRTRYEVNAIRCSSRISFRTLLRPLRSSDLSFSWFALGYAARAVLLGKVLGRPSIVIAGGWDVLGMPEIGYGAARSLRGRLRARLAVRNADLLLAFSEFSRDTIRTLAGREAHLVYLGVDCDRFRPGKKEDLVVSVGNITEQNLKRKGMEAFVQAAAHLPGARFILAGRQDPAAITTLRRLAPPNVEFPGFLPETELLDLLSRAKVYVQASYNEGFGLAVAEAMSSGCVPVVTDRGSLPEVVGDAGLYVPFGNPEATAMAIAKGMESDRSDVARRRILTLFPAARRRERVIELVEGLLGR